MDIEAALAQFDVAEANLRRLEKIWSEMEGIVPEGIAFIDGSAEGRRYRELVRGFQVIAAALPAIAHYRIEAEPWELDAIAQSRLDAAEVGELSAEVSVENGIEQPGREIDEYRFRLDRARRDLARDHLVRLMGEIDRILSVLPARVEYDRAEVTDPEWANLVAAINQVERLAGSQVPRSGAWANLGRHMAFGQGEDLHDIAKVDWPPVRGSLQANLYSELDPLPMAVSDLASLVESKPGGTVSTALNWTAISDDDFERLLFNIVADADGYANPQLLTRTHAPDRGRDISADRTNSRSGERDF